MSVYHAKQPSQATVSPVSADFEVSELGLVCALRSHPRLAKSRSANNERLSLAKVLVVLGDRLARTRLDC